MNSASLLVFPLSIQKFSPMRTDVIDHTDYCMQICSYLHIICSVTKCRRNEKELLTKFTGQFMLFIAFRIISHWWLRRTLMHLLMYIRGLVMAVSKMFTLRLDSCKYAKGSICWSSTRIIIALVSNEKLSTNIKSSSI